MSSLLHSPAAPLSDEVFRLLRDLLYVHSGVRLDDNSKIFVESRLQHSLKRRQLQRFEDYYYFLKYDARREEELANFIDLLTIHETYFFREEQQLKAFSEETLPEIASRRGKEKELRIWSAGCSTGEEPYTIAMLLKEHGEFSDWHVEIIASDVSQKVLQSARRGVYQPSSFRTTDPYYLSKYFQKEEGGHKIVDGVKERVTFLCMNLLDPHKLAFINLMDVIFCRNVIIYFDTDSKKKLIEIFTRRLHDSGFLFLGHAESLLNISTAFSLRHFKNDLVYQKGSAHPPGGCSPGLSIAHPERSRAVGGEKG